jgi:hypothetical protein
MLFLAGVVLVAAGLAGLRARRRQTAPASNVQRSGAFLFWAITGFVGAGALLGGPIGLLLLPLAAVAAFFTARSFSIGQDSIGLIAGFGLLAVGFAVLNLGNRPCSSHPSQECGGADPIPWLLGGLACLAFAVVAWLLLSRSLRQSVP